MLKHTEKKQAYLSEEQFVSNLKNRRIILSLVKTPTMGRNKRWAETLTMGVNTGNFSPCWCLHQQDIKSKLF